ncbi:MAG TPA: HAD family phosphatase [Candidatus Angelobacter sp.]|jgi:beta-phosphoglucomutase
MSLRFQGVAFDLEGTIVDLESAHHQGHLDAAAEVGLHLSLEQAINEIPAFVGGPDVEIARAIQSRVSQQITVDQLLSRMKYFYSRYRRNMVVRPRPGFDHILSQIERLGILTCIGSVTNRDEGIALVNACGLDGSFSADRLVFAEDVMSLKPAPDVYLETARRMSVTPMQQIVFEDSVPGVQAAVAAGSTVIAIPVLQQNEFRARLLHSGAALVYATWADVDISSLLAA